MTDPDLKDKAKIFWMVKGYIPSDKMIIESYDDYIKRLWISGSSGAPLYDYEEGFEEAWMKNQIKK